MKRKITGQENKKVPMASEERVAIVTGAGSGIGRAAASRLAGLGIAVVAVGRRHEALVQVVALSPVQEAGLWPSPLTSAAPRHRRA